MGAEWIIKGKQAREAYIYIYVCVCFMMKRLKLYNFKSEFSILF